MAAEIIDGRSIAADLKRALADEIGRLAFEGIRPGIATLLLGKDPASAVYRRTIERLCTELGLHYRDETRPADTSEVEVIDLMQALDDDRSISGILPLRPFPENIRESVIVNNLSPRKDIDCLHPYNMGRVTLGKPAFAPATAAAAIEVLESYYRQHGIDPADGFAGAEMCVVGHSNTAGKPITIMALGRNATVTTCHIYTSKAGNLARHTREADVLIVAAGVPDLIGREHVKPGAVVVDVGINQVTVCPKCEGRNSPGRAACVLCGQDLTHAEERIVGDVDFEQVRSVASAITPVPGGVGSVTNMMLIRNAVRAARLER